MLRSEYTDIKSHIVARAQMLDNASPDRFWLDGTQIENSPETVDRRRSIATQIDALGLNSEEIPSSMPRLRFAVNSELNLFLADIPVDMVDQAGRPTGIRLAGPLHAGVGKAIQVYTDVCCELQWPRTSGVEEALQAVFYDRPKVSWYALVSGIAILVLIVCVVFLERSCRQ